MAFTNVNVGSAPNAGDGDPLRTAFQTVNSNLNETLNKTGDTMTGALTLSGDPTAALEAATKQYVDAVAAGLDVKNPVRVATTANISLSGEQTIDGVAVVAGDRVLVKDQITGSENGIYEASATAWSRAPDADEDAEVTSGLFTLVLEGTEGGGLGFVLTTADPITLDTTALTFTQFSDPSGAIDNAKKDVRAIVEFTGSTRTMVPDDGGKIVHGNSATAQTVTFDGNTQNYTAGLAGSIVQKGAGQITISVDGGITLKKAAKFADFTGSAKTDEQESVVGWYFEDATTVRVFGDLVLA